MKWLHLLCASMVATVWARSLVDLDKLIGPSLTIRVIVVALLPVSIGFGLAAVRVTIRDLMTLMNERKRQ